MYKPSYISGYNKFGTNMKQQIIIFFIVEYIHLNAFTQILEGTSLGYNITEELQYKTF